MSEELSPEELSSLLSSYMPDIPGYRVIRRIGKGGMSYVYLGVQVSLDRQVAIKVMSPEALTDEKSKQRFEHEAHTIAKLEHPCIVGIHEVGRTPQGLLYYVLPYLARGHLGQRDFTNDEGRIIEVLRALLSALEYAHTRGIVHRDVKAENVLFDNADRPLLTDFGIALSRHDTSRITTAGLAVGSGGYMSPEQARGEAVDGRADLYSVGVLAYELLNGRLPYLSNDPLALALMHAQDPIPRLPFERKHWQGFLDRSMAKSPDNRYRNAQQMLGALNQLSGKAIPSTDEALGVEAVDAPVGWVRPALLGVAGLALVAALALFFWPAPKGEDRAAEFFRGTEPVAEGTAPSPSAAPAPAIPPSPATSATDAAQTDPPVAPASQAASGAGALLASIASSATVVTLEFDPTLPGAREISAARRQLAQNRLSTPPGDNAIESLLEARRAGAAPAATAELDDQVLDALGGNLATALKAGDYATVRGGFRRAEKFASESGRLKGEPWKRVHSALVAALLARLEKAGASGNATAILQARAMAPAVKVDPRELEPAWSRIAATPALPPPVRSSRPDLVSVGGTAFMRTEVSRADYAAFASSTGRPTAHCRNRTAPITLKKRTWVAPGFEQTGSHPAVCVSFEDATAYARWLSQKTGESYRLPTATEWRRAAGYQGNSDPCRDGRIACGEPGTVPVGQGPSSPQGLSGMHGNAREWLNDCAGNCRQRLVTGLGWRDGKSRAEPLRSSGFDADTGFDDVGFRLVHEASRH